MGAETTYYVRVLVAKPEVVEVRALTSAEAIREAHQIEGVVATVSAHHWTELCQNCGCLLPDGCGGLFEKNGAACKRNSRSGDNGGVTK